MSIKDLRFVKFVKAVYKHHASGRDYLSKEEIMERMRICKECEHFTGTRCTICGCCVKHQPEFFNKLCYPLEHCPNDPPKWDAK